MKPLRVIDAFSGIGGFTLAAEKLGGFETICFIEKEPYCQKILKKHWSHIPVHDDILSFQPEMGSADVVCGGFPCQDISFAGKQAGINKGTRSGLFYELMRIICVVRPRFVVLENVSAILGNGLDTVLGHLSEAGFDAEWACIPASAVGACHQRDRWWLVAYSNNSGSQGLREELELHQGSGKVPFTWCHQPRMPEQNWRRFVSKPLLRRGDDGLSGRVDRLKALGNTVVPAVAQIPLARVLQLANETSNP
jgi:DNA (cytosine-5)-methyltransferase 1